MTQQDQQDQLDPTGPNRTNRTNRTNWTQQDPTGPTGPNRTHRTNRTNRTHRTSRTNRTNRTNRTQQDQQDQQDPQDPTGPTGPTGPNRTHRTSRTSRTNRTNRTQQDQQDQQDPACAPGWCLRYAWPFKALGPDGLGAEPQPSRCLAMQLTCSRMVLIRFTSQSITKRFSCLRSISSMMRFNSAASVAPLTERAVTCQLLATAASMMACRMEKPGEREERHTQGELHISHRRRGQGAAEGEDADGALCPGGPSGVRRAVRTGGRDWPLVSANQSGNNTSKENTNASRRSSRGLG
ncbi:hypothetical protein EYF80_062434 [Liparis tanakae]|uniref:Uncharacterized protein n=1 Tax=Liparis tanakae TaxID=230148 RepID=A0A4Z2EEW3_9TELE|nr:hypothetical protein EYF80_062434 [Liparis tanakae]